MSHVTADCDPPIRSEHRGHVWQLSTNHVAALHQSRGSQLFLLSYALQPYSWSGSGTPGLKLWHCCLFSDCSRYTIINNCSCKCSQPWQETVNCNDATIITFPFARQHACMVTGHQSVVNNRDINITGCLHILLYPLRDEFAFWYEA